MNRHPAPRLTILPLLALVGALAGCASRPAPELGRIYNRVAQESELERNPVILIPGILGSKLKQEGTDTIVWGAFSGDFANPERPEGARLVAVPMAEGVPLNELRDDVVPNGVLDDVRIRIAFIPLELSAYRNILTSLGVGGYRDEGLGMSGAVDYGDDHFTCFQFDYDWRRDNIENARRLHAFILEKKAYVQREMRSRFGVERDDLKFDIVAHSMGGLISRYYLRYGDQDLPADGALPDLTWAGAEHVGRVILVGTPNAGSTETVIQLVEDTQFAPICPRYDAEILGTMPSIYQLLPRDRHHAVVESGTKIPIENLYDADLWTEMGWGLASPDADRVLRRLLPDVPDAATRRRIALDHLDKCLRRAERFHAALDVPARLPAGTELHLFAGDAKPTLAVVAVDQRNGALRDSEKAGGDGTVLRSSALMDERLDGDWTPRLRTPIEWTSVRFLFTDHLGLTKDAAFTDNVLYLLLEAPR